MNLQELTQSNANFMITSIGKFCFDPMFKQQLKSAYLSMENEEVLYSGLQNFNPPLGAIVVDPYSILMLEASLPEDIFPKLAKTFRIDNLKREDKSLIEIPLYDENSGDFQFFIDIIAYTKNSGNFARVKDPLKSNYSINDLEKLAHFGVKCLEGQLTLKKQEQMISDFQEKYLEKHFGDSKKETNNLDYK